MFDTHYDLLSVAYKAYITGDYSFLENQVRYYHNQNVKGLIANLYFMSPEEMSEEIHPDYYREDVSVLEMFTKAKEVIDAYLPDIEIVYSIEGADYIKDCDELEALYNAGLDALVLCWNTESKYASGNRSEKGLTEEGRQLLDKCVELGIAIDFSHANVKTFYDMIDFVKEKQQEGKDVICYASHSNVFELCERDRNLTIEQIKALGEVNGSVGLLSSKYFVVQRDLVTDDTDFNEAYLNHIKKVVELIGIDKTMISTDDMNYAAWFDPIYDFVSIYDYGLLQKDMYSLLDKEFAEDSEKIIYLNGKKIYDRINDKRNINRGVKK